MRRRIALLALGVALIALLAAAIVQQESEGRSFVNAVVTLLMIAALAVVMLGALAGIRYLARRFGP